ncbi:MAG: hypothetical protein K2P58_02210 [Hyphomonadaceae bacterium]|nr:hypothetical protein [Hyphomonadaceae bacterium]
MSNPSDPVDRVATLPRKRTEWLVVLPGWISALAAIATLGVAISLTGPLSSMESYFQSELALRNMDLLAERDGRISAEEELSQLRQQLAREVSRMAELRAAEGSASSSPFSSAAAFDAQYLLWRAAREAVWSQNLQPSQHIPIGAVLAASARSLLTPANLQADQREVALLLSALEHDCAPATSITMITPSDQEEATRSFSDAIGRAFAAYNECLVAELAPSG